MVSLASTSLPFYTPYSFLFGLSRVTSINMNDISFKKNPLLSFMISILQITALSICLLDLSFNFLSNRSMGDSL